MQAGVNLSGEASRDKDVSRSASEPGSASLHTVRAAKLSKKLKPNVAGEETSRSNLTALRGERGRRASKEQSRNLGDSPSGKTAAGNHNQKLKRSESRRCP